MQNTKGNSTNSTRKGGPRDTARKKKEMLASLKSFMGVVAGACDKVGIDRHTHYNWLASDEEYRRDAEAINERALDLAESKLLQLIKKENPQAVFFLLETRGKSRGYVKKQELEHSGNARKPIAMRLIVADPEKRKRLEDAINSKR
jgi:hypothetical protein